jgi:hypothetical protein
MRDRLIFRLSEQIAAIVQFEGPLHMELLIELLKEINSVARVGVNVQSNVSRAIDLAIRAHNVEQDHEFVWARGAECRTFRVPGDGVLRPLSLIPPEEIQLAVLYIVEDQFGYPRDAMPRAIAEVFGFERPPSGSAEIVGDVVDGLIDRGLLRLSGLNVYLP